MKNISELNINIFKDLDNITDDDLIHFWDENEYIRMYFITFLDFLLWLRNNGIRIRCGG